MSDRKKVCMVTGGSKGIGRQICLSLAESHDVVAFNHFDPDGAEADKTLAMLGERGVECLAEKFDVSDPDQVKRFMGGLVDKYGGLDALVNNAGITADALLVRMSMEQFHKVLQVNLVGTFVCTQQAAKVMMKQRSGSIVSIASVVGKVGNIGQANYSASKAGIMALTKTAAKELATRGVRVNAIAPGYIETDMTAAVPEKAAAAMRATIPMGRPGQGEDVAKVVAFLCSDAAAYMTGQVLHVDGGMYM